jgi:hypothetical protein
MMNFKQWLNESFTDKNEKVNQIAKRIWANVAATVNREKSKTQFNKFQILASGLGFSSSHVYGWLTQRLSGREEITPENQREAEQMAQQMASAPAPPEAQYTKGSGWHHWIINGDMGRAAAGTSKTYIPIHYKSLLPNAQAVMSAILKNLVHNGYKGQIKIAASGKDGWLDRMDNIVLHSGTPEWAQFGANITKQVLDKFGVKIGGAATTGEMEQGLDPKGTGESFNGYVSKEAATTIEQILQATKDYDHFMRNIQNHFAQNGPFVQQILKILP